MIKYSNMVNSKVDAFKLIKRFHDMSERATLLTGPHVTQDDLFIQIMGTIIAEGMEESLLDRTESRENS